MHSYIQTHRRMTKRLNSICLLFSIIHIFPIDDEVFYYSQLCFSPFTSFTLVKCEYEIFTVFACFRNIFREFKHNNSTWNFSRSKDCGFHIAISSSPASLHTPCSSGIVVDSRSMSPSWVARREMWERERAQRDFKLYIGGWKSTLWKLNLMHSHNCTWFFLVATRRRGANVCVSVLQPLNWKFQNFCEWKGKWSEWEKQQRQAEKRMRIQRSAHNPAESREFSHSKNSFSGKIDGKGNFFLLFFSFSIHIQSLDFQLNRSIAAIALVIFLGRWRRAKLIRICARKPSNLWIVRRESWGKSGKLWLRRENRENFVEIWVKLENFSKREKEEKKSGEEEFFPSQRLRSPLK